MMVAPIDDRPAGVAIKTHISIIPADRSRYDGYPINLGDALLADALATALETRGRVVDVLDFGGGDRRDTRSRVRLHSFSGLVRHLRSVDLAVVGGGTLIQHEAHGLFRAGLPRFVFLVSLAAWLAGTPMVLFAVGCDPVASRTSRIIYRLALWRRPVWVRDEASLDRVANYFRADVRLAADASLFLWEDKEGAVERDGSVLVALNFHDAAKTDQATIQCLRALGEPRYLNMHQDECRLDTDSFPIELVDRSEVVPSPIDWTTGAMAIGVAGSVVASRMHALYLAAILGTPMIATSDSAKVRAFAAEFEVPYVGDLVRISSVTPKRADTKALMLARSRLDSQLDAMLLLCGA